jgi:hypothetical protein
VTPEQTAAHSRCPYPNGCESVQCSAGDLLAERDKVITKLEVKYSSALDTNLTLRRELTKTSQDRDLQGSLVASVTQERDDALALLAARDATIARLEVEWDEQRAKRAEWHWKFVGASRELNALKRKKDK